MLNRRFLSDRRFSLDRIRCCLRFVNNSLCLLRKYLSSVSSLLSLRKCPHVVNRPVSALAVKRLPSSAKRLPGSAKRLLSSVILIGVLIHSTLPVSYAQVHRNAPLERHVARGFAKQLQQPRQSPQHRQLIQRMTVVSIPALSFDYLHEAADPFSTAYPLFRQLLAQGAVGAMNLRTKGPDTLANSYATLAAGRRVAVPQADGFYQVGETVKERQVAHIVQERLGIKPRQGVVYPTVIPFDEANRVGNERVTSALLGERLKKGGIHTAVWGNTDVVRGSGDSGRFAPFMAMDRYGRVEEAVIDAPMYTAQAGRPGGVKTNYDYLLRELRASKAQFRIVELGDLFRLQEETALMTDIRREKMVRNIMHEMDRFLAGLAQTMGQGDVLWLLSPVVETGRASRQAQLAPTIWYEPGRPQTSGGILTSGTTRRTGIIANIDVAPTVLQAFGVTVPRLMVGRPVTVSNGLTDKLWPTLEQVLTVYRLRPFVIYTYAFYQVAMLLIALWLLLNKQWRRTEALQIALLCIVLTPVLFLVLATVPVKSSLLFSALLMGLAFTSAALLKRLPTVPLFFVLGIVGFMPVLVDGLCGGSLIQQSFLGYDPIIGARYYGIGNEYMGVVLGSVILMVAALLEWKRPANRWHRLIVAALFTFLVFYFSAPFLGTNAGGALAATIGFGVAYARFYYGKWQARFWLSLVGLGVVGALCLLLMNVTVAAGPPSHVGRAFSYLLSGDFAEIVDIASRKLMLNIRLIKGSLWGKVFFVSFLAMTVIIIQPMRGLQWLQQRYPYLFHGFTAIVVAAFSALVLNDSGIVSAATAIVYVVIPLLIIICRDWQTGTPRA